MSQVSGIHAQCDVAKVRRYLDLVERNPGSGENGESMRAYLANFTFLLAGFSADTQGRIESVAEFVSANASSPYPATGYRNRFRVSADSV